MKDFSKRWSQQLLQALGLTLLLPLLASGQDVCHPSPCGSNTQCIGREGRPVCVCLPGYRGNPLVHCQRGECAATTDCPSNRVCRDYSCVDVCEGQCGSGAQCTPRNHIPVCTCPPGHTGDPLHSCRPFNPHRFFATWIDDRLSHPRSVLVGIPREELCQPSPCGANTQCDVVGGVPTCSCLPGYIGQPLSGCRHECETDYDCPASSRCSGYKCEQVCTPGACGSNARCEPINHRAVCNCVSGTFGDAYGSGCHHECESHYDCPSSRPACSAGKCIDPCAAGVCGVGADCRVKDRTTPVCSCPRDMTGDPFVRCRPFEKRDLCVPNPCGSNAECTPGHDQTGKERPVCTCPPGFLGNALVACHRGECQSDSDCRYDQACSGYTCRPACQDQCGIGAQCQARNHVATCTCPPGTTGQPLARCNPIPAPVAAVRRNGRLYYTKKK